ncbi:MAG: SH3 domain-containing protein [Spirochaetes bacterium]|nr:SH3 domain-containing protein [Spirochaetota bacterium]
MNNHELKSIAHSILSIFMTMIVPLLLPGAVKAEKIDHRIDYGKYLQMTTTAQSGLKMREEPSMRGKEITTIPVNTTVYLENVTDKSMDLSGVKGHWVEVLWKEKSVRGYVFSGFLKKKSVPGFRFMDQYRLIYSGYYAEGEEAVIDIGGGICPDDIKQGGNSLEFSESLPPAFSLKFTLSGTGQKIAFGKDGCGEKCYRLTIKISKYASKKVNEELRTDITGSIVSMKSIKPNECRSYIIE